jgi:hypothetical protein
MCCCSAEFSLGALERMLQENQRLRREAEQSSAELDSARQGRQAGAEAAIAASLRVGPVKFAWPAKLLLTQRKYAWLGVWSKEGARSTSVEERQLLHCAGGQGAAAAGARPRAGERERAAAVRAQAGIQSMRTEQHTSNVSSRHACMRCMRHACLCRMGC